MNNHAPLFEALKKHTYKSKWSFHVPGHKAGSIFNSDASDIFKSVLPFDVTELSGLDDLHHPEDVIKEAQELLAAFYQVNRRSYFLVGGSTAGNLAMILGSFLQGDVVLVQRNCHKSVYNALELADVTPVFLSPEIDELGGFPLGVTLETVKEALKRYPNSKGIVLTNPNYYGMQQDIRGISELIHRHNGLVLVDEAHGAHFKLDQMPNSSLSMGADAVVQSAHKTLPALTMGAFLHVNSHRVNEFRISQILAMIQSSSPSYLIMASLDLARHYIESFTSQDIHSIVKKSDRLTDYIDSLPHFQTINPRTGYAKDPLKITIQSQREISGYELQQLFEEEGVYTELADSRNVLFVLPLGPIREFEALQAVFKKISKRIEAYQPKENAEEIKFSFAQESTLDKSYSDMKKASVIQIRIEDAEGFTAAGSVIPYPPGIPLIAKGEKIKSESIHLYLTLKEKGARFQGLNESQEMFVFKKGE